MSNVKRVYVEKKPAFAVQAKELKHEVSSYLGIKSVTAVRVLIRYDVENISDEVFDKACKTVFAEPPVDDLYLENFEAAEGSRIFSVEFLPGQFDQRADSAVQCVQFLDENAQPIIRSATTYVIEGTITDEEFDAIKHHCINPVDSRETGLEKPETLVTVFPEPEDVKIFDGFKEMPEAELKELYDSLNLAMTFKDFQHIQHYFKEEEVFVRFPTYTKYISREFLSKDEMFFDRDVSSMKCNVCDKPLKVLIDWFSDSGKMYYCLGECQEHGYVRGKIKVKPREEDSFFVVKIMRSTDEEGAESIREKQESIREKRRERRQKSLDSEIVIEEIWDEDEIKSELDDK